MAIFVDEKTKVVVQGITGAQGRFYALRNRAYGTKVVAGTNPKKAGTDVEGIPVFASVRGAVEATGANASMILVPARARRHPRGGRGGHRVDRVPHRGHPRPGRGPALQPAQAHSSEDAA